MPRIAGRMVGFVASDAKLGSATQEYAGILRSRRADARGARRRKRATDDSRRAAETHHSPRARVERGWVGLPRRALVVALCAVGCSSNMARSTAPAVAQGGAATWAPAWLPPYTPEQQKLLSPVDTPVQVPAAHTYP